METNSLTKEHVLVCLSSSPSNPKVIKTASEMSKVFKAEFTALYIETSTPLSQGNKQRLLENTMTAKNNNAKIVMINGEDIAFQVSQYAKAARVTKIVIGRSGYKPNGFFNPPNFIDKLIELNPDIEIYVIPDKVQKLYIEADKDFKIPNITAKDSLKTVIILIFATGINLLFSKLGANTADITLIYVLAVLLVAYFTESKFYSVLSSFLIILIYNFLFTEPYQTFLASKQNNYLTFLIMFIVAFFSSNLTKKSKEQSRKSSIKAYSTEVMLEMSQQLQKCNSKSEITNVTIEQIKKLLDCDVKMHSPDYAQEEDRPDKLFIPIQNTKKIFAIVEIGKNNINEFQKNLINAMLRESALAYENEEYSTAKNELLLKNKQEELRSTLLRAISHDLRTPLTGISGYADLLIKNGALLSDEKKSEMFTYIYDDSVWLLNLIENILSITRFDENKISINKESEFIEDIITEAVSHLGREKKNFKIKTVIENEFLSAKMDGKLISQVVFNLVNNAIKYSPENTTITVRAKACDDWVEVSVEDEGCGISDENKKKIFEMFYTVNTSVSDGRRGLGLGLALCKAVVEAHGGQIDVKDNKPCGAIFSFKLKGDFYDSKN